MTPRIPFGPRLRVAAAVLSLVPLAGAAAFAAGVAPTAPLTVARGEAAASPAPVSSICPGPLVIPDELLDTASDSALAVVPPNPAVSVRSVALQSDSSLLFGRVSASATGLGADGRPVTPSVEAEDADGDALKGSAGTGDLGDTVLSLPGTPAAASLTAAAAAGTDGGVVTDSVQSSTTGTGDFRSLTLVRCAEPTVSATFLGAPTTTGASSALVLTNPGSRPATASVRVWGEDGPADMQGRSRVVVAPGTTERILLESIAPGEAQLGVRVDSSGAPLSSYLQTTERDGLTPAGAELLSPQADAATEAVVPGVRSAAGREPVALILNPSDTATTADVSVSGATGDIAAAAQTGVEIPAGQVVAVPLTGAGAGDLSVRVSSTTSVGLVTSVRSSVAGGDLPGDTVGAPVDSAVSTPAPAIGDGTVLALPVEGPDGLLSLTADADTGVTVIPIGADGTASAPVQVDLTVGQSVALPSARLGAAAALSIVPDTPGTVHGAWVQAPSPEGVGPLLATVSVPAATGDAATPVVRAG